MMSGLFEVQQTTSNLQVSFLLSLFLAISLSYRCRVQAAIHINSNGHNRHTPWAHGRTVVDNRATVYCRVQYKEPLLLLQLLLLHYSIVVVPLCFFFFIPGETKRGVLPAASPKTVLKLSLYVCLLPTIYTYMAGGWFWRRGGAVNRKSSSPPSYFGGFL